MLPDLAQASLGTLAQFLLPEHQHLLPAEEPPEPPELGAVKAAVCIGENPVLQWQGFAAPDLLFFKRKGEGQRIVPPFVLHCPVRVGPVYRIAQNHNEAHRRVVAPDSLCCWIPVEADRRRFSKDDRRWLPGNGDAVNLGLARARHASRHQRNGVLSPGAGKSRVLAQVGS